MERESGKPATITDVAKQAGVALSTASRALNGGGYVKPETRDRVLSIAKELQYIPNTLGRGLKTAKTGLLGLAIPDTSNPIYFQMIEGVRETAKKHGYSIVLFYTDGEEREELQAVRLLQRKVVDALFLVHFSYSEQLRNAVESATRPIALCGMCNHLWAPEANKSFDTISIDVRQAVYDAVVYLIGLGHKQIVYLAGKPGIAVYHQRFEGYQQALADHGLPYDPENVFWCNYNGETGRMAARYFRDVGKAPEAVCASNDLQILGFYTEMRAYFSEFPSGTDMVSIDNIESTQLLGIPGENMREEEVGRTAAEFLFDRLENPETEDCRCKDTLFIPRLVERTLR